MEVGVSWAGDAVEIPQVGIAFKDVEGGGKALAAIRRCPVARRTDTATAAAAAA